MIKNALLGATLALALCSAKRCEAQGVPHAFPVTAASGNVAAASAVATLPGAPGLTTFISGFEITASGATAAACVNATVTGLVSGNLTYAFCAPAGVTTGAAPLVVNFNPPIPAASVNTPITLTLPSLGAGNVNAAVATHGFQE
ncbi:MAG: hypothetical protein JO105_03245 [Hyphomicrobiales bacterium]|nr:hypothetical protein [Hyphomicrobiales bacterium]